MSALTRPMIERVANSLRHVSVGKVPPDGSPWQRGHASGARSAALVATFAVANMLDEAGCEGFDRRHFFCLAGFKDEYDGPGS